MMGAEEVGSARSSKEESPGGRRETRSSSTPSGLHSIVDLGLRLDGEDGFQLIKRLHTGIFGSVYLVKDYSSLPYAKRIAKVEVIGESSVLEEEFEVGCLFNDCPHTTNYVRFGEEWDVDVMTDPKLNPANVSTVSIRYLVMENAGNSFDALQRRADPKLFREGNLDLRVALKMAAQINRALDWVHNLGYVHRDVSPGNVAMGADGEWRLIDFGMCDLASPSLRDAADKEGGTMYFRSARVTLTPKAFQPCDDYEALFHLVVFATFPLACAWRRNTSDHQQVAQAKASLLSDPHKHLPKRAPEALFRWAEKLEESQTQPMVARGRHYAHLLEQALDELS